MLPVDATWRLEDVEALLGNDEAAESLTSLTGDAAAEALDDLQEVGGRKPDCDVVVLIIQQALDALEAAESISPLKINNGILLRRRVRRLLFRLSRRSGVLPPSLFVTDVYTTSKVNAVCLGGFADVFEGTLDGKPVALKRLRVTQQSQRRLSLQWVRLTK